MPTAASRPACSRPAFLLTANIGRSGRPALFAVTDPMAATSCYLIPPAKCSTHVSWPRLARPSTSFVRAAAKAWMACHDTDASVLARALHRTTVSPAAAMRRAWNGVKIGPGPTAFTRMPSAMWSAVSPRVRAPIAALVVWVLQVAAACGDGPYGAGVDDAPVSKRSRFLQVPPKPDNRARAPILKDGT